MWALARIEKDDILEQYPRRNILVMKGVAYRKGENTNWIAINIFRRMGFNVTFRDIDRSHRNGFRHNGYPRVILVKLLSHDLKDAIYQKRHRLRGIPGLKHIFIDENLTVMRRKLFSVRDTFRNFECWTDDGKIRLRDPGASSSTVYTVTCERDFNDLLKSGF